MQANRTNQIMKVLTFISTLLLPLTFITGLYGMNIGLPLQDNPYAFLILIAVMVVIVLALIIYFKRRRWM
jgi:magnesium transporter